VEKIEKRIQDEKKGRAFSTLSHADIAEFSVRREQQRFSLSGTAFHEGGASPKMFFEAFGREKVIPSPQSLLGGIVVSHLPGGNVFGMPTSHERFILSEGTGVFAENFHARAFPVDKIQGVARPRLQTVETGMFLPERYPDEARSGTPVIESLCIRNVHQIEPEGVSLVEGSERKIGSRTNSEITPLSEHVIAKNGIALIPESRIIGFPRIGASGNQKHRILWKQSPAQVFMIHFAVGKTAPIQDFLQGIHAKIRRPTPYVQHEIPRNSGRFFFGRKRNFLEENPSLFQKIPVTQRKKKGSRRIEMPFGKSRSATVNAAVHPPKRLSLLQNHVYSPGGFEKITLNMLHSQPIPGNEKTPGPLFHGPSSPGVSGTPGNAAKMPQRLLRYRG
jgi:hypothetical protein